MKKIVHSISGKFLLISAGLIVFWIITSFLVADRISTANRYNSLRSLIKENITRSVELKNNTKLLILQASMGSNPDNANYDKDSEQKYMAIIAGLNSLESEPGLADNVEFSRNIKMIKESCNELKRVEDEYTNLLIEKGGINSGLILRINTLMDKISLTGTPLSPVFIPELKEEFRNYLIENDPSVLETIINDIELTVFEERGRFSGEPSLSEASPLNLYRQLVQNLQRLLKIDQKLGYKKSSGLSNELLLFTGQISDQLVALDRAFGEFAEDHLNSAMNRLYLIMIITGIVIAALIIRFSSRILRFMDNLSYALKDLSEGKIPARMETDTDMETRELAAYTNRIAEKLELKTSFAKSLIENGENKPELNLSDADDLGNALAELNRKLISAEEMNTRRIEEERKRNWHNEGIAQFGEIFQSESENIEELSFRIIKKLVNYLDASHGLVFIINDEEKENESYELTAAFAYDRRKYLKKQIRSGEGLTGTCALEKQSIYLTDIPDDYLEITTGLGESPPGSLLIVPLIYEEKCIGIMEIASLKLLQEFEINFVERLAETIATTLSAARSNIMTLELLQQSQKQAEEMAAQEEKMRKNIEEIQRAQEESRKKEFEISGILDAINNSSMVAEYSLNGRIAEINEKFSKLLEMNPDQLIGKHHSEFSTAERHSNEYKQFWSELKNGQTKYLNEKFRLFNGKEIWLRQSYTPIKSDDGNILKILNIAYDISETIKQEQSLREQADEIVRKNIEMQSLSEAINKSIMKCELSPEGIVLDVNQNYCDGTGLSSKELSGKNQRLFLKDSEIENFDIIMDQVVKGKDYSGVVRRTKPTGEEVWLMSNFSPVRDEKGIIYKIYFLAQDITEKKLKYQLLEEANKEIERLGEELDKKNNK